MIWAFDLDGTLIGSVRSERLRPGAMELLDALRARGVTCILWSAGGRDYARRKSREHEIHHHFAAFYAKEERDHLGCYVVDHVDAAHRPDVFVDDAPTDLSSDARVVAVPQFLGNNDADRSLLALLEALESMIGPDA